MNFMTLKKYAKRIPLLKKMNMYRVKYKILKSALKEIKRRDQRKAIIYFGIPNHTNLGDQAQTYCTFNWLNKNYPGLEIYGFHSGQVAMGLIPRLQEYVLKDDIIFIQSGYNTTDLYLLEENMHREVLRYFPNNRVVIMPQTVFFKDSNEENISRDIYNNHRKMVFFARDEISYKKSKDIFSQVPVYLYPDIVTSLIGNRKYSLNRDGILLCVRHDKESILSKLEIDNLVDDLSELGYKVTVSDTTIDMNLEYLQSHRGEILENIFEEYSNYQLVITDRYHGTIFSLIAATPVLVLGTSDHKLSSGVKWFPEEFTDYVSFSSSINDVMDFVKKGKFNTVNHELPPYFSENYYDKLKTLLEDTWKNENM